MESADNMESYHRYAYVFITNGSLTVTYATPSLTLVFHKLEYISNDSEAVFGRFLFLALKGSTTSLKVAS